MVAIFVSGICSSIKIFNGGPSCVRPELELSNEEVNPPKTVATDKSDEDSSKKRAYDFDENFYIGRYSVPNKPSEPAEKPTNKPSEPTQKPTNKPSEPTQKPTNKPSEPTQKPTNKPLGIVFDSYDISSDGYYYKHPQENWLIINDGMCISGSFHYTRALTEKERLSFMHGGELYDSCGKKVVGDISFWSSYDGLFSADLPEDLPSGTYTLSFHQHINDQRLSFEIQFSI